MAIDLVGSVLRRRRPLDDAIDDSAEMATLAPRDRAFARLLVATVLRRLGQIDALIAHCLNTPLPPRAAMVHDMLRLGLAQLQFLRTPPHAAVATTVDLAGARGFPTYKGLVNAVLRRLSLEGPGLVATQDAPRLNTPIWLWDAWSAAYGEATARAIATAHLKEAPLDITVRGDAKHWAEVLEAKILPTGTLRRSGGGAIMALPGYQDGAWWVQDAAAAMPAMLFGQMAGKRVSISARHPAARPRNSRLPAVGSPPSTARRAGCSDCGAIWRGSISRPSASRRTPAPGSRRSRFPSCCSTRLARRPAPSGAIPTCPISRLSTT